jgi:hypothetical protein
MWLLIKHTVLCLDVRMSRWLNLIPSSITQGYEDWLRHKADNEVNGAPVFVVRSGSLVQTRSKNIRVSHRGVIMSPALTLSIPYTHISDKRLHFT